MTTRSLITDVCDGCGVESERAIEGLDHVGSPDGWSTLHMERPISVEDLTEHAAIQATIDSGGNPDAMRAYFANLRAHGMGGGGQTLNVHADLCPACANGGDYRAIIERLAKAMLEEHEAKLERPGLLQGPFLVDIDTDWRGE